MIKIAGFAYPLAQIKQWAESGQAINPRVVLALIEKLESEQSRKESKEETKITIFPWCDSCGNVATRQCGFNANEVCTAWLCQDCKHSHQG